MDNNAKPYLDLIIGSGGLAKDIYSTIRVDFPEARPVIFNNTLQPVNQIFNQCKVLKTFDELALHFKTVSPYFNVAIANPLMRYRLAEKIKKMGGLLKTQIAKNAYLSFAIKMADGCIIEPGNIISGPTILAEGVFLNCACIIGHDVEIGQYTSFGPGVRVLGNVTIGEFCYIGTNAIIHPNIKIGNKVVVGIGKIVDRNLADGEKFI